MFNVPAVCTLPAKLGTHCMFPQHQNYGCNLRISNPENSIIMMMLRMWMSFYRGNLKVDLIICSCSGQRSLWIGFMALHNRHVQYILANTLSLAHRYHKSTKDDNPHQHPPCCRQPPARAGTLNTLHTYTHTHIHTYTHTHIHIHTYTHSHIHTYTQSVWPAGTTYLRLKAVEFLRQENHRVDHSIR